MRMHKLSPLTIRLLLLVLLLPILFLLHHIEWTRPSLLQTVHSIDGDRFVIVDAQGAFQNTRFGLHVWHWRQNQIRDSHYVKGFQRVIDGRSIAYSPSWGLDRLVVKDIATMRTRAEFHARQAIDRASRMEHMAATVTGKLASLPTSELQRMRENSVPRAVAFSRNGRFVVISGWADSDPPYSYVGDLETNEVTDHRLQNCTDAAAEGVVAFSANPIDGAIEFFEFEDGQFRELTQVSRRPTNLHVSLKTRTSLRRGDTKSEYVIETFDGEVVSTFADASHRSLGMSGDTTLFCMEKRDGIVIRDCATGNLVSEIDLADVRGRVTNYLTQSQSFTPDNQFVAIALRDESVRVYEVQSGAQLAKYQLPLAVDWNYWKYAGASLMIAWAIAWCFVGATLTHPAWLFIDSMMATWLGAGVWSYLTGTLEVASWLAFASLTIYFTMLSWTFGCNAIVKATLLIAGSAAIWGPIALVHDRLSISGAQIVWKPVALRSIVACGIIVVGLQMLSWMKVAWVTAEQPMASRFQFRIRDVLLLMAACALALAVCLISARSGFLDASQFFPGSASGSHGVWLLLCLGEGIAVLGIFSSALSDSHWVARLAVYLTSSIGLVIGVSAVAHFYPPEFAYFWSGWDYREPGIMVVYLPLSLLLLRGRQIRCRRPQPSGGAGSAAIAAVCSPKSVWA